MVPRCYPTVKGWTAELLKERQRAEMSDSEFGMGHMYDRYKKQPHEESDEDDESEYEDEDEEEEVKTLEMNDEDEEGTTSGSQEKTFIDKWKEVAKDVKGSLLKMVDLFETAPDDIRKLNSFKIMCDATRNAMGLREEGVQHVIDSQKTMTEAMGNDEIDDPEWIDIMIELTKAAERTYILKNRNEFPTFTLIPEYENTPDENQNFNQEKEMEKEKDDEVENEQEKETEREKEMANEAAQKEKEKVLEKDVQNEEYEVTFKNDSSST